jgi:hypothetical protein
MTAIVAPYGTGISLGAAGTAQGGRVVFRNPRGTKYYYVIYEDDSDNLVIEKSSNGVTWSETPQTILASESVTCSDTKIMDTGSQLDIFMVFATNNIGWDDDRVDYVKMTISDSASDVTINSIQNILTLPDGVLINSSSIGVAIARTDNGELIIVYSQDKTVHGKDYRETFIIGSDGDGTAPTWSGTTSLYDPSGDSNNDDKGRVGYALESYSSSQFSGDGALLLARLQDSTGSTTWKVSSDEISWDSGASTFGDLGFTDIVTNDSSHGEAIGLLIDEADYGWAIYNDGSSTDLEISKTSSAGSDNFGTGTQVYSALAESACIALDTGPSTDVVYIFYHNSTDTADLRYKTTSVSSISLSDEQIISYHQNYYRLSIQSRPVENSLHLAAECPVDTIVYNEIPVYKALSTTLADLEFPDQNYYLGPHST